MKTTLLMSKAVSSASNRWKNFLSLSSTFWVIGLWKGRDRKKPKDKVIKISKFLTLYFLKQFFGFFFQLFFNFNAEIFKLNDRLRHLLFCLILERNFRKLISRKPHVPIWKFLMYLKKDKLNFKIMWSVVLETERTLRKNNLNWKKTKKRDFSRFFQMFYVITLSLFVQFRWNFATIILCL